MSKSRGNVVNPDDIVEKYGADAMRLYEMFMGPLEAVKPWQTEQIAGVVRFQNRVYGLASRVSDSAELGAETERLMHQTIRKVRGSAGGARAWPVARAGLTRRRFCAPRQVTQDVDSLSFNTAISAMMIYSNHLQGLKDGGVPREALVNLVLMLAPLAPHLSEEARISTCPLIPLVVRDCTLGRRQPTPRPHRWPRGAGLGGARQRGHAGLRAVAGVRREAVRGDHRHHGGAGERESEGADRAAEGCRRGSRAGDRARPAEGERLPEGQGDQEVHLRARPHRQRRREMMRPDLGHSDDIVAGRAAAAVVDVVRPRVAGAQMSARGPGALGALYG